MVSLMEAGEELMKGCVRWLREIDNDRFTDKKILAHVQQFCRIEVSFLDNPPRIGD